MADCSDLANSLDRLKICATSRILFSKRQYSVKGVPKNSVKGVPKNVYRRPTQCKFHFRAKTALARNADTGGERHRRCPRRARSARASDKRVKSGFWQCSPCQFRWEYEWDEFIHLLEGRVTISDEHGNSHTLVAGDVAHFPKGLKTTWRVEQLLRKFTVIRTDEPLEK